MSEPLIFTLIVTISAISAVVVSLVVLRFTTVLTQMQRTMSMDRSEYARQVDEAHVQAFGNAMTALREVQGRIADNQAAMFERTMDMVHGPQRVGEPNEALVTDDPRLDMRPSWMPDDDFDYEGTRTDPTDEWLPTPEHPQADPRVNRERAVSVRPGETLVPHG